VHGVWVPVNAVAGAAGGGGAGVCASASVCEKMAPSRAGRSREGRAL